MIHLFNLLGILYLDSPKRLQHEYWEGDPVQDIIRQF
jgi:hypothetical protein